MPEDEPGKWDLLFEAIPPLAGFLGSIFGQDKEVTPKSLPPLFPEGQQALADWLFSGFFQKPGGGFDLYKLPTPISPEAGQAAQREIPGLNLGQGGAGTMDIMGMPLFPSIGGTRLPEVFANWQPWDAGTQYMADYLYNKNPVGTPDPDLAKMVQWGGTGGPGNQAMSLAMQYGAPSQAGQYASNMAQFGVSSEGAGRPLQDLAYGRPTAAAAHLMPFLNQQRNPYIPAPIPQRDVRMR